MANKRSFCSIIAFHNFATLKNWLTYQCPSSWPVVITMKKKLASTCKKNTGYRPVQINQSNPEKTGRSCEGADFSWLSSKVSRTLMPHSNKHVVKDKDIYSFHNCFPNTNSHLVVKCGSWSEPTFNNIGHLFLLGPFPS